MNQTDNIENVYKYLERGYGNLKAQQVDSNYKKYSFKTIERIIQCKCWR